MLSRLLRSALEHRLAVLALSVLLLCVGAWSFHALTVEAFPDPTDTQVQVISLFPGQPTEEVERRVTLPLERVLNGMEGLYRQRSISMFGLSFITLTFDDTVDAYFARQRTLERMAEAELPEGVQPSLAPLATPIGEVYRYTLEGPGADPMLLRTLQEWTVTPELMRVQGVADVVSYGGLVKEIHVQPDPARMAALKVPLSAIFEALEKASTNATGGFVERGAEMFVIRSLGIFRDLSDIRLVRVANHDGTPVLIQDVATVEVGYAPRQGIITRDDNEDAVMGIVLMRRGENPSVVLDSLRERIAELNDRILPNGVHLNPFYDRTDLVNTTLKTVFHNVGEGAFLVVLVFFVFLLSIRGSLIVAAVIPLSLAGSFLYLHARGMSANLLSLGAVDFGIVVDGAVIMVEHLFFRMAGYQGPRDERAIAGRIHDWAMEVARPTLFSMLIIIAAYLPIFSLERVEGRMFAPMANMVVSALVGSLLMSFTIVPVLSYFALRRNVTHRESPALRWARRIYEPALDASMSRPGVVAVVAAGALISALTLASRLGTEFMPELNEGALWVAVALPTNTSITEGRKITPKIKEILRRTPEVSGVMSQLGRPEDGTDDKLFSNLEMFVKLAPKDEWRRGFKTLDGLSLEMARNLQEIPGIEVNFSQPIRDNVAENIAGQKGEIAIKIYGEDMALLQKAAEDVKNAIAEVPGAAELGIVKVGEVPQLSVAIDRMALARYDLDLADVQQHLETAMGGHVASELWEGEKRFDVTVRLPLSTREDAEAIRRVMIPLPSGELLPLSAVADVKMATGRAAITRENGRRYAGVRANVRDRDLGSFVEEARATVDRAVELPPGYWIRWGGEFENQQRAMARLRVVIPLALLLTFCLLFSAFRSLWDSLMILAHIPIALVGGVVALAIVGLPLSVSGAIGFIALLGQATTDSVLVLSAIRARRQAGEPLLEAARGGARDRLRAVLMTTLLACLGLLPAALSRAIGSEVQRPIAVVVVGGTLTAALLSLLVLPTTYAVVTGWWERRRSIEAETTEVAA
ncbi:efflux RND transporter permease subunit [Vulgatibacter incomptus]|uniref:Cobalt-zinc-cadmium resistance protein CzcA n=1 Tax=Vulgatibacter incomptus TaxID=1391653 RepID=A0A0K1PAI3_9BACT|nr:CusA/CzcA family heavy metal efflux RND transporter [Vulgatibacter incomptus]AKU90124.1 Cobalt-zinc-cadmium resistance protein CzcA [Vulgatibacter incomptus]